MTVFVSMVSILSDFLPGENYELKQGLFVKKKYTPVH